MTSGYKLVVMRIKPSFIIKTLKLNNLNVSDTAKSLGINRSTVYRWIAKAKYLAFGKVLIGSKYLKRKSTKPHTVKRALSAEQRSAVMSLRSNKQYSSEKIRYLLKLNACVSTIKRFMHSKNMLRKQLKYKRPKYQPTTHMNLKNTKTIGYLQMDVKYITPELSGLAWTCFEYAVIDIYSRYKEAVILNQVDQDGSILALMEILPRLPFKVVFIQTDNGLEFQSRFVEYIKNIGLTHHFIHKNTPNENAVIERSFRTDEEEFFLRLEKAPKHYDQLKEWFSLYLKEYNTYRPHLGINLKTPMEVVAYVMNH